MSWGFAFTRGPGWQAMADASTATQLRWRQFVEGTLFGGNNLREGRCHGAPVAASDKDVPMKADFLARLLRTPAPMRHRAHLAGGSVRSALPTAALQTAGGPADALERSAGAAADLPGKTQPGAPLSVTPSSGTKRVRGSFAGLRPVRSRRPLAEVLRLLGEGRRSLEGVTAAAQEPEIPAAAEFQEAWHATSSGSRRYRLYLPASLGAAPPAGLVLMLHGCRQNPEDFAIGTGMNAQAEAHRLIVAYPGQTAASNGLCCWNWFRPGDQGRGDGEPAMLASLAETLRDRFGVPADRVFVAGLSAGGAMSAVLAETYPDVFAAAGIHSGVAAGMANDAVSAFAAMCGEKRRTRALDPAIPRARVIVFQGTGDRTVHPVNAKRLIARHGAPKLAVSRSATGGRSYTRSVLGAGGAAPAAECWLIDGQPHAWSGGVPAGSYTDPTGPAASAEMVRFFLQA